MDHLTTIIDCNCAKDYAIDLSSIGSRYSQYRKCSLGNYCLLVLPSSKIAAPAIVSGNKSFFRGLIIVTYVVRGKVMFSFVFVNLLSWGGGAYPMMHSDRKDQMGRNPPPPSFLKKHRLFSEGLTDEYLTNVL